MKSAHKVKAYRNNTDTAGKAAFLGSYLTKETVDIEKLCEQTAAQSGLTAIQVRAILEGSFDAIAELEKEGLVIVHLDGLTVMAVITGSFPTSDAPFDGERNALELAIRLDDDIRLAFVNETAQMVTDATMARVRIDNVMDLDAPRPMNIIHGVKPFRVAGFNMVMDDEGAEAYLQNSIGVTFPVTVDEVASTQLFTAHVAAAVEPGDYRLVVKSRGGDPEGVLQTTFRRVKCLAVASTGPVIEYAYSAGHEDVSILKCLADGLVDESFITREDFKRDDIAGYIYKISKKSTGEFYIGQTIYLPIFRWGQHLKTDRFDMKGIVDYQFEVIEIVPITENILAREKYYIQKFIPTKIYSNTFRKK